MCRKTQMETLTLRAQRSTLDHPNSAINAPQLPDHAPVPSPIVFFSQKTLGAWLSQIKFRDSAGLNE